MRYIKIVLTIIAVLLSLNVLARCFVMPVGAHEPGTIQAVDIVRVDGNMIFGNAVPVQIK